LGSANSPALKLSPMEERVISQLVDKGIRDTKPSRAKGGITYSGLEDLVKEIGGEEVRNLLRNLTQKGLLKESSYDSSIFCPHCNSVNIYSRYSCPQCQSMNVRKVQLIEHLSCGYIGNRAEFYQDKTLICPKCRTEIGEYFEAIKKDGDKRKAIRVIGSSFSCDKCGGKFERPQITHTCEGCAASFTYRDANYEQLPSYELTEKIGGLAPNKMLTEATSQIERILVEKGYTVEYNAKLVGKSSVEQSFDIAARRGQRLYLLEISSWGDQNDLISLLGKKMDIDADSVILVDLSGNPTLASLGKPYGIEVLNGKDPSYIEKLSDLISAPEKEAPRRGLGVFRRRSKND